MMNFTNSDKYKNNPILKETFEFSILIVGFSELLDQDRKYVISKQIIRSGTSIGANVKEAQKLLCHYAKMASEARAGKYQSK